MYDLAVIGAGAGGIAAAKGALKAGLKVVLIDKTITDFGGTCINRGCIPTKFFLNNAKHGKKWNNIFTASGELIDKIKSPLIKYLTANGLDFSWGEACFMDKHNVDVAGHNIDAKNFIIACGSSPRQIIQGKNTIFAENIFSLSAIPDKVLIVGAGYIGIEIASLLNILGTNVTIVEKEERILPGFDARLANRFRIILETKGIHIDTGKTVSDYSFDDFGLVIMAVGRQSNSVGLGLDKAGVKVNERGWIETDKAMRTNVDNIYACGDVTGKMMLAYTAEHQAAICIKNITRGIVGPIVEENYNAMASCVFSIPQIAHTGMTEDEAKAKNKKYRIIKSNFLKFSSSYVYEDNDGYIQIIIDDDGAILGADIISSFAGELIGILTVAIAGKMNISTLKECLLVHPTLSEIVPLILRDEG